MRCYFFTRRAKIFATQGRFEDNRSKFEMKNGHTTQQLQTEGSHIIQISHNLLQRNSLVFFGGGKLTTRDLF
jgi:hypothetical protein